MFSKVEAERMMRERHQPASSLPAIQNSEEYVSVPEEVGKQYESSKTRENLQAPKNVHPGIRI